MDIDALLEAFQGNIYSFLNECLIFFSEWVLTFLSLPPQKSVTFAKYVTRVAVT